MKAAYADGWVGYRGTRLWAFNVSWNGGPLVSGSSSAPIERLNLVLWHYAFSGFDATPGPMVAFAWRGEVVYNDR